jgi:hypothetical protein
VLASESHLFPPRPAYRFRQITNQSVVREDEPSIGHDPPYGAGINYYLNSVPPGNVTVTIFDDKGQVVRTLPGTQTAGINRLHWDLRYTPTTAISMRMSQSAPGGRLSVLAPPGTYTVKLSVGGRELSQPLIVRKDPHSAGTEADIRAQMAMLFELRGTTERAVAVVNQIELVRSQIDALGRLVEDAAVRKAGAELSEKLIDIEQQFIDARFPADRGARARLLSRILYLASQIGSADFKPTEQQVEVQQLLAEQVATHERRLEALRKGDLAAFTELVRLRQLVE